MNKQGADKIDWTDYTWNPISGCKHGCSYCYMNRMEKRFPGITGPAVHSSRFDEPSRLKAPSKIFVGSSGDMWGRWVDSELIIDVLFICLTHAPQHTYQFLTKNPTRFLGFAPLSNGWYGTTVDGLPFTQGNLEKLVHSTPCAKVRFVSFEPLLAPVVPDLSDIDWIIIGADSTKGAKKPNMGYADILIDRARETGTAIWMKDNYGYPERIKEWPEEKR